VYGNFLLKQMMMMIMTVCDKKGNSASVLRDDSLSTHSPERQNGGDNGGDNRMWKSECYDVGLDEE